MQLKVFLKLKKTLKPSLLDKKNPKNPKKKKSKKPKKPKNTHWAVFFLNPGFFQPCLTQTAHASTFVQHLLEGGRQRGISSRRSFCFRWGLRLGAGGCVPTEEFFLFRPFLFFPGGGRLVFFGDSWWAGVDAAAATVLFPGGGARRRCRRRHRGFLLVCRLCFWRLGLWICRGNTSCGVFQSGQLFHRGLMVRGSRDLVAFCGLKSKGLLYGNNGKNLNSRLQLKWSSWENTRKTKWD